MGKNGEGFVRPAAKTLALALACSAFLADAGMAGADERAAADSRAVPVASDARLAGDAGRTRFVLDLTRHVDIVAFTLADPYRVVVDLPQVTFDLPPKAGEGGRGLVKAFRYGLVLQGASRIVLDLSGPVRVDKAFVLDAVDGQPARLVLDLAAVDRDSFMRNIALENRPQHAAAATPKPDRDSTAKSDDQRPLIVLDPGHGGLDSGTVALTGENEKELVLAFALMLRDRLEKSGKYRVIMTRSDDRFVPLGERVQIARSHHATLFMSIHADSMEHHDSEARGASVYTLSEHASDTEAARLADDENRADVIAGVDLTAEPGDVADILIDLAQRETKTFSLHLARTLVNELKTASRLHKHPIKSAGFRVLKAPDVPSVLVELGYVSNGQDLKLMLSDAWRSRATDAIAQAINTYFATRIAGSGSAPGSN